METMHKRFRGEVIYQAETDIHFPHLTVGQTLLFASLARTPKNRLPGVSRQRYAEHLRDVVMAVFGISHTINTKVGNDFVRGELPKPLTALRQPSLTLHRCQRRRAQARQYCGGHAQPESYSVLGQQHSRVGQCYCVRVCSYSAVVY